MQFADEKKSSYTWDKQTRRYRDERGRFSSPKDVRKVIDQLAATSRERMRELGKSVREGSLSVPKFQAQMAKELKNAHTAAFVLAKGGRRQVTKAEWLELARKLKSEYKYLENFAKEIPRKIADRNNRISSRAAMYGNSVISTYENAVREREKKAGMIYERRRLGATTNPCTVCISEQSRGWQPVGTLRRIGDSPCKSNCGCEFEFKVDEDK